MRLIGDYFKLKLFNFKDEHTFPSFKAYRKALSKEYRFTNPYHLSRGIYGETPLAVLKQIAEGCALSPKDHVADLGCGRGRGVLFLSQLVGCRVTGIESVPAFIEKAERVKQKLGLQNVNFLQADMFKADLSPYSIVYLFGTCLEDHEIRKLAAKKPSRIITISYPLSDCDPSYKLVKSFPVLFPWGQTDAFLSVAKTF